MEWTVKGCLKDNAEDVVMIFEADTEQQARAQAMFEGIYVSDIWPKGRARPATPIRSNETQAEDIKPRLSMVRNGEKKGSLSTFLLVISCVTFAIGTVSAIIVTGVLIQPPTGGLPGLFDLGDLTPLHFPFISGACLPWYVLSMGCLIASRIK